jgi:diaminohydroxyphosphoribosylaminopyrimidine deaminase/5-amino-6-(5-phosphoribosylamino)uracil reductase
MCWRGRKRKTDPGNTLPGDTRPMKGAKPGREDSQDIKRMKRALALAQRAEGDVKHYPMVGAVIVKNGKKVGEGYFKGPGQPHAEVEAIKAAGRKAKGSTLILNLEPCCHYGRTPPCTQAIIRAGIKRVVAGMKDPNPLVNGKGFRALRQAGIELKTGVLEKECKRINEVFVKYITKQEPFVILKAAATLDGRIADRAGHSKWITGRESRKEVHRLRDRVDVVMVGAGTVLQDDPRLTVRLAGGGRHPRPLVVDARLKVSPKARVFQTPAKGGAMVATTARAPGWKKRMLKDMGVEVLTVRQDKNGTVDLKALMQRLGKLEAASLLIEGGTGLFTSALESGIVDKVILFYAPRLLVDGKARSILSGRRTTKLEMAIGLSEMEYKRLGEDLMVTGYPAK